LSNNSSEPALRIKELRVDYGDLVAVDHLTLEIPPGEIYGLVGPNGAGKTSTFRVLATLMRPTYGEVAFCGFDLFEKTAVVRRLLGYMPDLAPAPSDIRVWEFLDLFAAAYGLRSIERKKRIEECLAAVQLTEQRGAICRSLSRGMTQRLVLAKTLLHRPRVLVLDEPASGMDPMSRIALRQTLRDLARDGATILASSHILSELAEMCTSVGILVKGRLVVSGTTAEVRRKLGGGARAIELTVLDEPDAERAARILPELLGVAVLQREKLNLRFDFAGDEREQAMLLRRLVQDGVAVRRFEEKHATFEEILIQVSKDNAP
jgi:ABC-2 type transport system ATP-binding protein